MLPRNQQRLHPNGAEPGLISAPDVLDVLHIDSCREDLVLTRRACEAVGAPIKFRYAITVEQALAELETLTKPGAVAPDLILLEILIERQRGMEVLDYIHADSRLSEIPLVIYTDALDPRLLARARKHGGNMVLEKGDYFRVAEQLKNVAMKVGLALDPEEV